MGLRLNTNVASITSRRHLSNITQKMNSAQEKLASGYRINHAADDAAGMAISETLRSEIISLEMARRNANDGVSLIQTAEGGLNEISNIIVRLKELAIQAASDTISDNERGFLQREFGSLKDEIDRIAESTEFNGNVLLVGNTILPDSVGKESNKPPLEIQVGSHWRFDVDGPQVRKPMNTLRLDFQGLNALTDGPGSLDIGGVENAAGTRIDKKEHAQVSIERLEGALEKVNSYRADLGAAENRMGSTIQNLSNRIENLSAAKSRIKDADFAEETAHLMQANILQQASVSMLAQANQMPQLALKLLQ